MNFLERAIYHTIRYSDFFEYPLSEKEIFKWLIHSGPVKIPAIDLKLKKLQRANIIEKHGSYYHLPGKGNLVSERLTRKKASLSKWAIARSAAALLQQIPTVMAIAVTGSLSMNNCRLYDDIDFLVICSPNSVWVTRLIIWLKLKSGNLRRPVLCDDPKFISDKICDNVYLDYSSMDIRTYLPSRSDLLYLSHEILQAKPVFNRADTYRHFLYSNSWVDNYLPNAALSSPKSVEDGTVRRKDSYSLNIFWQLIISLLNPLVFIFQYCYMFPKLKGNHVSLKAAFFHPKPIKLPLDKRLTFSLK